MIEFTLKTHTEFQNEKRCTTKEAWQLPKFSHNQHLLKQEGEFTFEVGNSQ